MTEGSRKTRDKNRNLRRRSLKNNKVRMTPEKRLNRLIEIQTAIRDILRDVQPGQASKKLNDVFLHIRQALCDMKSDKSLITQLIQDFGLENEVAIYSKYQHVGENEEITIIQGKTWLSIPSTLDEVGITLQDYLEQDLYFNNFESQPNSRKDIILKICNKETHHIDENVDPFVQWLKDGVSIPLKNGDMSGKELFMWDIFTLFDYYAIAIFELTNYKKLSERSPPLLKAHLYIDAKRKIANAGSTYDAFLVPSVTAIKFLISRTCSKCPDSILKVIDEITFQCPSCAELTEL